MKGYLSKMPDFDVFFSFETKKMATLRAKLVLKNALEVNHKRHFIKIPFISKGMEFIDLHSIFKDIYY